MFRTAVVVTLVSVAGLPLSSFAQSGTVTRSQVMQELADLRAVGYHGETEAGYPSELLAAEQRLQSAKSQAGATTDYGSNPVGSSAAGRASETDDAPGFKPVYFGQ